MSEAADLTPSGEVDPTQEAPPSEEPTAEPEAPKEEPKGDDYQQRIDTLLEERMSAVPDLVYQAMERYHQEQGGDDYDDGEEDEDALEPGDEGYEAQALQRYIQEQIQQGVQQALTPFQKQQLNQQRDNYFEELQDEFPDLKDEKTVTQYVEHAGDLVERISRYENPTDAPEFVELIELAYKASKADERAAQETPADGRTTPLESQGGAAPAEPEEDDQERAIRKYLESQKTL